MFGNRIEVEPLINIMWLIRSSINNSSGLKILRSRAVAVGKFVREMLSGIVSMFMVSLWEIGSGRLTPKIKRRSEGTVDKQWELEGQFEYLENSKWGQGAVTMTKQNFGLGSLPVHLNDNIKNGNGHELILKWRLSKITKRLHCYDFGGLVKMSMTSANHDSGLWNHFSCLWIHKLAPINSRTMMKMESICLGNPPAPR